jgi:gamma-glutamylcysteine synthetase
MIKYKKAFLEMLEYNQSLFNDFKIIHDNFQKDPHNWQDKFNEEGTKVLRIIRKYENNLCSKSENSGYGKFSTNLSDKFWEQVRSYLPLIDKVKII